jgi:hypothetical protein
MPRVGFEPTIPASKRAKTVHAFFFHLFCESSGTVAIPGLFCQPRMIMKMIMEKQMECRLAGETEVLGENLPQRHFCPSQNPTWPDPGVNPGRRGGKPATNRLSYDAATSSCLRPLGYRDRLAFHFMRKISWLTERLLISPWIIRSLEIINWRVIWNSDICYVQLIQDNGFCYNKQLYPVLPRSFFW